MLPSVRLPERADRQVGLGSPDRFRSHFCGRKNIAKLFFKGAAMGVLALGAASGPASAAPIPPPPGLVSWWPGDVLLRCPRFVCDIAGDNEGLLKGGATYRRGLVAAAFSLDGVDDFVLIPDHGSLNLGEEDFTIDLWVKFRTTDGEQVIAEKWIQRFGDPSSGWTLTKLDDNTVIFAAEGVDLGFTPAVIETGTWYFIAVSREEDQFRMYWDGEIVDTWDISDPVDLDSTASLKFGHRCNPQDTTGCEGDPGFYLDGLIDEVELFDRALGNDEIAAIYDAGSDGKIKRRL